MKVCNVSHIINDYKILHFILCESFNTNYRLRLGKDVCPQYKIIQNLKSNTFCQIKAGRTNKIERNKTH